MPKLPVAGSIYTRLCRYVPHGLGYCCLLQLVLPAMQADLRSSARHRTCLVQEQFGLRVGLFPMKCQENTTWIETLLHIVRLAYAWKQYLQV